MPVLMQRNVGSATARRRDPRTPAPVGRAPVRARTSQDRFAGGEDEDNQINNGSGGGGLPHEHAGVTVRWCAVTIEADGGEATVVGLAENPPDCRYAGPGPAQHRPSLLTLPTASAPRDGRYAVAGAEHRAPRYRDIDEETELLFGTKVLIVDDCALYRDYLAAVVVSNGGAPPGFAWDLHSLITSAESAIPSVVLVNMMTRDSATLLRQAVQLNPTARVIVFGVAGDDESEIVGCAEAGVAGYHLRPDSLDDLMLAIHKVAQGEFLCPPSISAILLNRISALAAQRQPVSKELVLTAREIQILRMLEAGQSNREIAEQLCIAVHTVKNHVHSLLTKLGVSSRAQAAARARAILVAEQLP